MAMNSAPGWILGRCEKYDFGGVLAKIPEGEGLSETDMPLCNFFFLLRRASFQGVAEQLLAL